MSAVMQCKSFTFSSKCHLGGFAGWRMTCVTDLNSKQNRAWKQSWVTGCELCNGHSACSCCTLFGPPCAGVPIASPDPPSAASGGPAVSEAPATRSAVTPARHVGSPPPAAALTAASPGYNSYCERDKDKEREKEGERVGGGQMLHNDRHHHCFKTGFFQKQYKQDSTQHDKHLLHQYCFWKSFNTWWWWRLSTYLNINPFPK